MVVEYFYKDGKKFAVVEQADGWATIVEVL
ncbi:hypothetical protein LW4_044 [Lactococcus phage LW4]|uniref:Uncharacterized protein n=4 Tax=Teubervirus LW31 TaxID=2845420 RepID=A0A1W6JHX3_9CAUD|nr:hypothetical protein H1N70_gp42 [Lactococcus phage LW31]ARM65644.1 hypothetical protein LW31_042 [Lactococcus phage LW31]ARM65732.1 hypothetical protein LW32_045 [Lactococcus phage LW32]ARM65818.1 hypothetical protein LW33_044 [Lactococcus phage LW33]ARM65904.1 hypothetical protein LW4_044 [Lactococcus phage LW4]